MKRMTLHASLSFCERMFHSPFKQMPFAERGLPSCAEFSRVVNEVHGELGNEEVERLRRHFEEDEEKRRTPEYQERLVPWERT